MSTSHRNMQISLRIDLMTFDPVHITKADCNRLRNRYKIKASRTFAIEGDCKIHSDHKAIGCHET